MIEIKNLSKSYESQLVLNRLNLTFAKGSVTGVLGPNACGKSTLMKCILGLAVPSEGEISILDQKVDGTGHFKKLIGYMPQNPNFPVNLTVHEQLNMLEDLREQQAPMRDELIHLFDLEKSLTKAFGQLSGGTKQKVAAVSAFMFRPPVIVLDEPTAGLDPLVSVKFKDLVSRSAKEGTTIILVSHLVSEIQQLATYITFLGEGEVIYSGLTQALLARAQEDNLERALAKSFAKEL